MNSVKNNLRYLRESKQQKRMAEEVIEEINQKLKLLIEYRDAQWKLIDSSPLANWFNKGLSKYHSNASYVMYSLVRILEEIQLQNYSQEDEMTIAELARQCIAVVLVDRGKSHVLDVPSPVHACDVRTIFFRGSAWRNNYEDCQSFRHQILQHLLDRVYGPIDESIIGR